ncbi:MarR family transcriptional regulator [Pseudonocardia sp. CNS-004]|nr:MarR family transcriptional regulator [Pseudonocardia sp. CNS-004]
MSRRRQVAMRDLHRSLVELVAQMNLPQRDDALLAEAGVALDRALLPLLVGIQRYGPIGVGELADRAGRDYTTVSRQVAKLAELGLIDRRPGPTDRRVNEAVLSTAGRRVTDAVDSARHRLNSALFDDWSDHDLVELERLVHRYVDDRLSLTTTATKPADHHGLARQPPDQSTT